jgi:hypothetical protein
VVDVGKAKDDGGEEDGVADGGLGQEEEGNGDGAKEYFFGYGALV